MMKLIDFRNPVRVEKEVIDESLQVVHHYGHGLDGVLLSPGSAETVVQLVKEVLNGSRHRIF